MILEDIDKQAIKRMIEQKRRQILIHSYLYYEMDETIWTDARWYEVADELVILSKAFPEVAEKCVFADDFKDFERSTGFDLFKNPKTRKYAEQQAKYLLRIHEQEVKRRGF